MELWIKNIGATADRLRVRWFEQFGDDEFRRHVRFSDARRPSGIARRDLLLHHAYVEGQEHGRLCGVVRASADAPIHDPRGPNDQWPWRLDVAPLLRLPVAGLGPTLTDVGLPADFMNQNSHVTVDPAPFRAAVRLMADVAMP
jgi:hypothetical protein